MLLIRASCAALSRSHAPFSLFTQYRTTFTFYSVAYLPFVVMALTMTLGSMLGPVTASPNRRAVGASMVGAVVIAAVLSAWFFYPIWTAEVIPYAVFTQYGSEQAVKDAGRLQIEGKDHVVADGDILHIRFNV